MADVGELNIMAVEHAIQRELAYRRMVAMIHSPSNSNFYSYLRSFEVQSSNVIPSPSPSRRSNSGMIPRLSGTKQQAPTNSLEFFQALQPDEHETLIDDAFCKVCEVPCSGSISYKQHINGKQHKLKLWKLKIGEKDNEKDYKGLATHRPFCLMCGIWCSNEDNLKAHLKGQKHKNVLAKVEFARKNGREMLIQQNSCELCNIGFSDYNALKMHFNGKMHRDELHNLQCARKDGADIVKQQYRCEVCDIWSVDRDSLNSHLHGRRHILKHHRA